MRTMEEIEEVQAKRETIIRLEGDALFADCLNRRIGDKDGGVKLAKLTLRFPEGAAVPDYIIQAAIKLTLIRVQDDARRTMSAAEIAALDGTVIDAQDFWASRQDRKARAVRPMTVEKAQVALGKMGATDQAKIIAALLKDRPELLELLKK